MSERTTKEQTEGLLGTAVPGESVNKSTPKRGKASRIDAKVLELAKAAWSAEDLGHFDTRDIIGQLLEVIERQDYEMDCLGQLLYDAERLAASPASALPPCCGKQDVQILHRCKNCNSFLSPASALVNKEGK